MKFAVTFKTPVQAGEAMVHTCTKDIEVTSTNKIHTSPEYIAMLEDGWELSYVDKIETLTENKMKTLELALFEATEVFINTLEEDNFFTGLSDEDIRYTKNRVNIFFYNFGEIIVLVSQIGGE